MGDEEVFRSRWDQMTGTFSPYVELSQAPARYRVRKAPSSVISGVRYLNLYFNAWQLPAVDRWMLSTKTPPFAKRCDEPVRVSQQAYHTADPLALPPMPITHTRQRRGTLAQTPSAASIEKETPIDRYLYTCPVPNCTLSKEHVSPHDLWVVCELVGCALRLGHAGAHSTTTNTDLQWYSFSRDEVARFQSRLELSVKYWNALSLGVLAVMGLPRAVATAEQGRLSEYPEGTKRKQPVLPSVRTLPLHTNWEITIREPLSRGSVEGSPYQKIDLKHQEIRLFRLEPRGKGQPVAGSFIYTNVPDCLEYIALSYTWGDEFPQRDITLRGGQHLKVRVNLWQFLQRQSLIIQKPTAFWIDAICIDQSNTHERNHQVALMKTIYQNAVEVFVWLGRANGDSDTAMEYISEQASKPLKQRGSGYLPLWPSKRGRALQELCDRPYWTRMWIIQELLHATAIKVWCGSKVFRWENLEKLYLNLREMEGAHWITHHPLHVAVLQSPAATMVWQRAHWRHPDTPMPRLQTLVEIFRDWKCADVRDKVFALVGMATRTSAITPDYTHSAREIYFSVMRCVEEGHDQFGILLAQVLCLTAREIDKGAGPMIDYRTADAESLVLRARYDNVWGDRALTSDPAAGDGR